jgi:amino acid transporter
MTLYGLGTIVGAGIFVLIGEVIGVSGSAAPAAFVLAASIAALTGLSYAQLAARHPRSAGEAAYVNAAFARDSLTLIVGVAVALSGMVSAATMAHGFARYFGSLIELPKPLVTLGYLAALGAVATWGIRESAALVGLLAISTVLGLLAIAVAVISGDGQWHWPQAVFEWPGLGNVAWFSGAFLAFYAFIGFEDLANLAEETHNPGRTLGLAIPLSMILSAGLYVLLCITALGALPAQELAASAAPMVTLLEHSGYPGATIVAVLGLLAITNGALAQLIMAARVLYGLSQQRQLPAWLARVHPQRHTPWAATAVATLLTMSLTMLGGLVFLAQITSALILLIFTMVNLALVAILRKEKRHWWRYLLPLLGAASASGLLLLAVPGGHA